MTMISPTEIYTVSGVIFSPEKIIGRQGEVRISKDGIIVECCNKEEFIAFERIQEIKKSQLPLLLITYVYVRYDESQLYYFLITNPQIFLNKFEEKAHISRSTDVKANLFDHFLAFVMFAHTTIGFTLTIIFIKNSLIPLAVVITVNIAFHIIFLGLIYLNIIKVKPTIKIPLKQLLISFFIPYVGPLNLFFYWQRFILPFFKKAD